MHTCTGAIVGSLQQPAWIKESSFLPKGPGVSGLLRQTSFGSFKPCRSLKIEGSLATGRSSTSSVPITIPEGGTFFFRNPNTLNYDPDFSIVTLLFIKISCYHR